MREEIWNEESGNSTGGERGQEKGSIIPSPSKGGQQELGKKVKKKSQLHKILQKKKDKRRELLPRKGVGTRGTSMGNEKFRTPPPCSPLHPPPP